MKRVLFLAYLFPPIANSGTQRPLKFTKFLTGHGWDPIVVTAAEFDGHRTDDGLLGDIPGNVRVVRVPMANEAVGGAIAALLGNTAIGKRLGNGVRWRMQHLRRTPDLYAWWQPAVIRAARRIFNDTGFEAIYATGFPWTSLVTARAIAELTGRPFIADFRDLWAAESLFRSERPPHEEELALERRVVESANAVICASETMSRMLSNSHPDADPDKFVTIHNGFDPADFAGEAPPKRSTAFRIVYTGVWKEGYNPSHLYDTIDWLQRSEPRSLENIEVIAAGFPPGEAQRRGLANHIKEIGFVPHHEAVTWMRSADLLYLSHVDADRQWVVPGKLYEYLASGTPVLALTDPDKETARIIRSVGGGIAVSPDDPGDLYRVLLDIAHTKAIEVPPRNSGALQAYERRHLAGRLAGVLNDVSRRAPVQIVDRDAAQTARSTRVSSGAAFSRSS